MSRVYVPRIVTLLPTFRRPLLLRRAIESALKQTFQDFEVWVLDNASGDETESTVVEMASRDTRIRYIKHSENIGVIRNFDFGLHRMTAPYFTFLSDDDVLLPGFYASGIAALESHPQAQFSFGVTWAVNEAGAVMSGQPATYPPGLHEPPDGLNTMLNHRYPDWQGCVFRREIIETVGTLDLENRVFDYDYMHRAAAVAAYVAYREPVALFTLHTGSSTADLKHDFIYPSLLRTAKRLESDVRVPATSREYASQVIQRDLCARLVQIGYRRAISGDGATARLIAQILRDELRFRSGADSVERVARTMRALPPLRSMSVVAVSLRRAILRAAMTRRHKLPNYRTEMGAALTVPTGTS